MGANLTQEHPSKPYLMAVGEVSSDGRASVPTKSARSH